ncbi:MAG: hypothetical protein H0T51_09980 [Pirellulales bacterium]|nr:hypothetical protein [Pirellulales bacterium]
MNYEKIAADKKEFHERHGGNSVTVDGWHLYANGARREVALVAALHEPPQDYPTRRKLVLKYYEVLLQQAAFAFEQLKNQLNQQLIASERTRNLPFPTFPPDEKELEELKALKAEADKRRKKLKKVQAQLDDEKPEYLRQREQRSSEHQESVARVRDQLKQIRI